MLKLCFYRRSALLLLTVLSLLLLADNVSAQNATGQQPYRLIGTIKGKDVTGAVLDDGANGQTFYRLQELLPDGSRIVKVEDDKISLKANDGSLYELFTIHDSKPSSPQARSGAGGNQTAPAPQAAPGRPPELPPRQNPSNPPVSRAPGAGKDDTGGIGSQRSSATERGAPHRRPRTRSQQED